MDDAGRSFVVEALRNELLGPGGSISEKGFSSTDSVPPRELLTDPTPVFATREESYGSFVQALTGEEILTRSRPTTRYGLGVLYPKGLIAVDINTQADEGSLEELERGTNLSSSTLLGSSAAQFEADSRGGSDDDDFDLTATTQYRPSAMGVSCLLKLESGDQIRIDARGGRYVPFKVQIEGKEREWWVRRPVQITANYPVPTRDGVVQPITVRVSEEIQVTPQVLARRDANDDTLWLVTAVLVNQAHNGAPADEYSLFQTGFDLCVERDGKAAATIEPYPDRRSLSMMESDPEERSLDLLYRSAPVFGIGHGCAATWLEGWGATKATVLTANPLPTFEAPSTTPDATLRDGTRLEVPIAPLAGLVTSDDGFGSIRSVVDGYKDWIDERRAEAETLSGFREQAAREHLEKCEGVLRRMQDGIEWIEQDPIAKKAFMLANRAVLYAQLRFSEKEREVKIDRNGKPTIEGIPPLKEWHEADRKWRAFQIGFIVAAARSAVLRDDIDRETVELIFFPTGGGKTEAYQGLAAFCMFFQRMNGHGEGVNVILRYTLRLLTSQQFLRAAALICAMEFVRHEEDLGSEKFSIGIWVGQATTPTTRGEAIRAFNKLAKGDSENPFLLLKCPWCSAQMGAVTVDSKADWKTPKVAGYRESRGTIQFFCPDRTCHFTRYLPIYVIDEDIYLQRPSIIVGTIDKFAMLAYRSEARRLFGIGDDGQREVDPPNLIIQDELHLIAGPLGSVAGLYETVIEQLCTDKRQGSPIRPKIIASTATIRRYAQQVKGLYDRDRVALFPPHGLDASDSFFAVFARDRESGKLLQGRLYVGVHAPGLGSMQTVQVRTASSLLQAAADLSRDERDPWWTLMMFFNSIRELGTSVSLLQSDVVDYLLAMGMRSGKDLGKLRRVNEIMELTSRMRQDEIPQALRKLERTSSSQYAIDACLASNIIEVGVDIQRLSLLMVVGQPKSTSQYIQITGRVGRNWQERPGLVVTLYGASKPRDRSHFEKFQSYHQRLYAEVEPASVTPFALPVLKRALHASMLSYIRQVGNKKLRPTPFPSNLFDETSNYFIKRAEEVDPDELGSLKRQLDQRQAEWKAWEPADWSANQAMTNNALFRRAGSWVPAEIARATWSIPMSMRDVDAECRGEITNELAVSAASTDEEGGFE
jgi:hypothetical protein